VPAMTDRLVIGPDVLVRPIGDESVLLNIKTEIYFGLDALGTRVWSVLTSGVSIQNALETLLDEYAVGEAELRADLTDLIDDLIRRELVVVAEGGAAR
jgi:hypothetical protein